jgi:nucleotide-binding universal stress UspA family protein
VRSPELIATENEKSAHNATQLMLKADATIDVSRRGEAIVIDCPEFVMSRHLARRARTYDLIIVPAYGHPETSALIESLVFDTGRPIMILPPEGAAGHRFESLVIGWDGSRAAARAMADSLPLCEQARNVAVVAVTGEKELPDMPCLTDAVRHLSRHGVVAEAVEIAARERDAGAELIDYCGQTSADLLVMGAYGHARAREFVLGGATDTVIKEAHLPVLLSH